MKCLYSILFVLWIHSEVKKTQENLNIKDLAFLNKNMQVQKSNVCFGMINEWTLCS